MRKKLCLSLADFSLIFSGIESMERGGVSWGISNPGDLPAMAIIDNNRMMPKGSLTAVALTKKEASHYSFYLVCCFTNEKQRTVKDREE